ncbi:radical SAM protein [Synechococcus sp. PROS-U-1]|uniref:radical SAM protein n=1 Tax=Synechococcus sp. PROS-U-1 TaxID=1400866 RepID=UPI001645852B|nr:radical SAM protein [Synechococcus sp. PROS-U-1]QNJ01753.1 radical SAM superfamily protein [Synechococcus sp. PROS-U-1]
MDKFRIDSHKYLFHPDHSSNVLNHYKDPENKLFREKFKSQLPLYIEISPVGACNHRCTFCAVDYIGYKSTFMNTNKLKESLRSMRSQGVKSIMYAGEGEPLLHPDISEIVNFTKEKSNIDVSFTTNAYKLNDEFIKRSLHNISWIKISFNGGDEDTYSSIHRTNKKDFHVVSNNIEKAVKFRNDNNLSCSIGLQTLLLPDNKESMEELCRHSRSLGADYLVIKPYSQHKFSNTQKYSDIDYRDYLHLQEKLEAFNTDEFKVIFRINTINNWLSQNNERYCKCISTPSVWAYIMADGDIYTCSAYLLDERFKLGNINEESFFKIWASEKRMKHKEFIFNKLDINECRVNCRMDQVNRYLDQVYNENVPHINFI